MAPPAIVVDNATGAGGTFCGGLAAGLAFGEPLLATAMRGAATAKAFWRAAPSACHGGKRSPVSWSPATSRAGCRPRAVQSHGRQQRRHAAGDHHHPRRDPDRRGPASQAAATAEGLRGGGRIEHLVLVGCGDLSFACEATALALDRHAGLAARWEHAHLMALSPGGATTSLTRRRHRITATPSIASRLASRRELARAARGGRSS